ncbi:hypothetical protein EYF80_000557 [Liparis tanakae]|uniref:Uncharacterized protein n=1 Tax=Liparis tanakae TaxID=230148 RepID=A0A4Z2JG77_9TELE|nr:hypothetical protein EYF80_000557 [Liparis tanakae]
MNAIRAAYSGACKMPIKASVCGPVNCIVSCRWAGKRSNFSDVQLSQLTAKAKASWMLLNLGEAKHHASYQLTLSAKALGDLSVAQRAQTTTAAVARQSLLCRGPSAIWPLTGNSRGDSLLIRGAAVMRRRQGASHLAWPIMNRGQRNGRRGQSREHLAMGETMEQITDYLCRYKNYNLGIGLTTAEHIDNNTTLLLDITDGEQRSGKPAVPASLGCIQHVFITTLPPKYLPNRNVQQLVPAGCLNQVSYPVGCRLKLPFQLFSL